MHENHSRLFQCSLATSIATASDKTKPKEVGVFEFDYGKRVAGVKALDSFAKRDLGTVQRTTKDASVSEPQSAAN